MNEALWADAKRTRVWENVDSALFRDEIQPRNEPAILKGLAASWPAVEAARQSDDALAVYLKRFSSEKPIDIFVGAPEIAGRYTFREDGRGFNFERRNIAFGAFLDLLLSHRDDPAPPSLYAGAINVPQHLAGLSNDNHHTLLDTSTEQLVSLWIGNRSRTAAHWDLPQNIACVLAGRRRYTLLPIEQINNLYVGPLDVTPAGRAISLVDFNNPDFAAHPRFRDAMAAAEIADLEPGDAVYVPSLWFHHVETPDAFGAMLNFWWRDAPEYALAPSTTLYHALLTLRDLPANERAAWRSLFDHYIFRTDGDPLAHLPADARGLLGPMTPEKAAQLKELLKRSLR